MRRTLAALACLAVLTAPLAATAQDPTFDAAGWRADLAQVREAFATRYANLEWAQTVREADLGAAFDRTEKRLATVRTDAEARALFDGLARHLADGHVRFSWPSAMAPAGAAPAPTAPSPCDEVAGRKVTIGDTALAGLPGYVSLKTPASAVFPAGVLEIDGRKVGVIRIAEFTGSLAPQYCEEALAAGTREGLYDVVHVRLTNDFADQLRALKAAGAEVLVVDITGNGGGSDWAEALMRMVTAKRLTSTRVDFLRGEHWTANFDRDLIRLEAQLRTAKGADRALLAEIVAQVKARRAEAAKPCDGSPWLKHEAPSCEILSRGFYSSGFLPSADPKTLAGRDWAGLVFSPMWYPYEEGVWSGPLLVAVDGRTGSAAEQFTAVLQDNQAAVVVGDPTAGAGCGYTWGGAPVTLTHSKGVLRLPDCVRIRRNGENEVIGISPDVVVGYHAGEGPKAKARRLATVLPAALARAGR
ncbi:S41 family peptidase [Brevundimonas sp. UBA2416]|uniref:S41 family peptidase n=1 Tax=Brevundimonas sp. UBA2416 TaxID=1946124 RepID=UPI0025BDB87C|nr:S41 family peptidase [Brevundimonas sp. UBA2416]